MQILLCQKRATGTFLRADVVGESLKGRRSCSPPLEMLSHFSPLAPFLKHKRISPSADGDQRAPPSGHLPPLEKVDETFNVCLFVWIFFFVLYFF